MRRIRKGKLMAITAFTTVVTIGFISLYIVKILREPAALSIESNPNSLVYISGEQKGKTPLELELGEEEVVVRLIPESFSQEFEVFEQIVKLTPGVKTIVRHKFSRENEKQESQIVSFESSSGKNANIAVVSVPDGTSVKVDGMAKGVTPLRIDKVSPGLHRVSVESDGYDKTSLDVVAVAGFTVTAYIDLAKREIVLQEPEIEKNNEDTQISYPEVEILSTPTGFLRVRSTPGISGEEVGQVSPGEVYKVLSFNAEEDWYEIEIETNKSGWISAKYATGSGEIDQ